MKSNFVKALKKAKKRDQYRLHMPGSKGKHQGFLKGIFKYDFTEIGGLDNLYDPSTMIAQSQSEMADDIGAGQVFYTVGGASAGVLALLSLFKGKKVLLARDFHTSAANALQLFSIESTFIYPMGMDIFSVVDANQVEQALSNHADIAAVYITYPNYYGFCADLSAIVKVAHKKSVPVIVDAAHSACFAYSRYLPMSPAQTGADAWVVSTHKTLPALNQSGYVAVGKQSLLCPEQVKEQLNCFNSTSPSYPIMASIDFAKSYMIKKGTKRIEKLFYNVVKYSKLIDALTGFSVVKQAKQNELKDVLKWVVDYSKTDLLPAQIEHYLNRKKIYVEAVDVQYVLMLLSPVDSKRVLKKVYKTLKKIKMMQGSKPKTTTYQLIKMDNVVPKSKETAWVDLTKAVGKSAAKVVAVYPPCVPAILVGDVITDVLIVEIKKAKTNGLSVVGLKDHLIKVYR